jgi:hypothetical protein
MKWEHALREIAEMGLKKVQHGNAVELERNAMVELACKALQIKPEYVDES